MRRVFPVLYNFSGAVSAMFFFYLFNLTGICLRRRRGFSPRRVVCMNETHSDRKSFLAHRINCPLGVIRNYERIKFCSNSFMQPLHTRHQFMFATKCTKIVLVYCYNLYYFSVYDDTLLRRVVYAIQ